VDKESSIAFAFAAKRAVLSCLASGVPHLPQKFEAGEFSASHFAQSRASGLPHLAQKLLSAGFRSRTLSSASPFALLEFHNIAPSGNSMQATLHKVVRHRPKSAAG
jgi:hypothetical protein